MKINRQPTTALQATLKRLTTTQPPSYTLDENRKKVFSVLPKGDESESLYAQHIREELARRSA